MTFVDLLNEYHIMPQFPPNVLNSIGELPKSVSHSDLDGRVDLTKEIIFTIDGDDAKDFDDAVSLKRLESGNVLLGVHIADVTHYVKENSPIDRAAFSRGTSVYLIDAVVPMLPFELSNELCSLKPGEIRLTVSVFMEIDSHGEVRDYSIHRSYIKSKARMTYKNVTKILEGDTALRDKYQLLVPTLEDMLKLSNTLKAKRIRNGSIEFVTHESKITLDKNGVPQKVEKYPITISNEIIEEFMLSANVTVAKHLAKLGLPCVYRVHESPDFERLERLSHILPSLGVEFPFKVNMKPMDFQKILDSVSGLDIGGVVNYLVLRSMSRAKYSEKNLGHFGLSFSDYCHFTSPIRRYPDVVVHRILKESLDGNISQKRIDKLKEQTVAASITASMTETNAADAELKWKDIKKAEYMSMHLGEKFDAVITHIMPSGFFAELENTVEGFVAARTIEDDVYMMREDGLSLEGMRKKNRYTIGDRVQVKAVAADSSEGKIDFEVVGTRPIRAMRSRKKNGKKELTRQEKQAVRRFKESYRQEKNQKQERREKANAEKMVFENAVVYEIMDFLQPVKKLSRAEKGFVGVTLRDMAAVIAQPIYKEALFKEGKITLDNALISAMQNTENTLVTICQSFGIEDADETVKISKSFVKEALRHFEKSIECEKLYVSKRESEYDALAKKLRTRGK